MTVEEAVDRMELVGHDFFLFIDARTDHPSVVYRRKGWDYGVISLTTPAAPAGWPSPSDRDARRRDAAPRHPASPFDVRSAAARASARTCRPGGCR